MEEEIKAQLVQAIDATWREIAHDVFDSVGKSKLSRAEVLDVVLDRLDLKYASGVSPKAREVWKAMDMKAQDAFAKEHVFTSKWYCV